MNSQSGYVEMNGANLYYEVAGARDLRKGLDLWRLFHGIRVPMLLI